MRNRLFIPVGLPGCGKSTLAHNLFGPYVISTDAIRAELGDVNSQKRNKEVFEQFHFQIKTVLANGRDVYADATNLDLRARNTLREIALSEESDTHCLLFTNVKEAIIRNAQRERRVPDDVMLRFIYKLEECLVSVPTEPFTSVTRIDGVHGVSPYATYQ